MYNPDMDVSKKIDQMVKSAGFDYAKMVGTWKGCDVYRLLRSDRNLRTGVPVMILVNKNGECRYNDHGEIHEIFDAVYA